MRWPALLLALPWVAVALACASPGSSSKGSGGREVLMSDFDDARAGEQGAREVEAQVGLYEDPELSAWLSRMGSKVLRGVPRRGFDYRFHVVDMAEPNAFALPGGQIYVSRGLLALANNEDEVACVLGHEIAHAAQRHAAAQQQISQRINPLAMPWNRAAMMAAYGRDMEREADAMGQRLCAAAGYDPMGMSTFLRSLETYETLRLGYSRQPSYFDSHPAARERAASNAVRARELRWRPDPSLGDTREGYRQVVSGLPYGPRPETGLFVGDEFLHPELGFSLRLPRGWTQVNNAQAVGAVEPRGEAMVFLAANEAAGDAEAMAAAWVAAQADSGGVRVERQGPVKVGHIDAWRLRVSAGGGGGRVSSVVTFIPWDGDAWRITGASRELGGDHLLQRTLVTARSLRPVTPEDLADIRVSRVEWVRAQAGEGLEGLSDRTGNAWDIQTTAIYNGVFADHRFEGGEFAKVLHSEPWSAR